MEHAYFKLLHVLSGHPAWALTVVLLAAFFESIAFIGTFVPGSTAMFVAGALVGTGSLNLGWVFACAIAGAVAGDAASYGFGSSHKETIAKLWPFRTHPGMLTAGQRYFEAHGAKSVIFARFIAPLRLRRVVQHPQDRQRSIEFVFEEILRDAEVKRKATVNPAAQVPACVVISEDSLAPTGDRRPQIDAAKRFAGEHLWIIGRKFKPDIESFFVIR